MKFIKTVFILPIFPIGISSAQLAAYDLVHRQMRLDALIRDADWKNGDYTQNPARDLDYEFGAVLLTSPENFNAKWTRQKVLENIAKK